LSARTRELFALIPVALLVTAGFTAVLVTNSDQLNASVFYGAYFLAVASPPTSSSGSGSRTPIPFSSRWWLCWRAGLVMLYRLDQAGPRPANWFVLGLVLFSATIIFLRDYAALERYRYLIALAGIILRSCRGSQGTRRTTPSSQSTSARSPSSPPSWPRSASSSSSPAI
jgi:hypothetical protein